MKLICWMRGHKLVRINSNPIYRLDKVLCLRCSQLFAMHHPTQYFGKWDAEDQEVLDDIPIRKRGGK